jgi:hypothetical protein
MKIEIDDDIYENDDEIEHGDEITEKIKLTTLDSRRRIERFFELRKLRELLDEPDLEDLL